MLFGLVAIKTQTQTYYIPGINANGFLGN